MADEKYVSARVLKPYFGPDAKGAIYALHPPGKVVSVPASWVEDRKITLKDRNGQPTGESKLVKQRAFAKVDGRSAAARAARADEAGDADDEV